MKIHARRFLIVIWMLGLWNKPLRAAEAPVTEPQVQTEAQPTYEPPQIKPFPMFLLCEGIILAASGIAVPDPAAYGGIMLGFSPLAYINGGANQPLVESLVGYGLMGGLWVYNIAVLSQDHISDMRIFRDNVMGWHVAMLGMGVAEYMSGSMDKKKKNTKLSWATDGRHGYLFIRRRFS